MENWKFKKSNWSILKKISSISNFVDYKFIKEKIMHIVECILYYFPLLIFNEQMSINSLCGHYEYIYLQSKRVLIQSMAIYIKV